MDKSNELVLWFEQLGIDDVGIAGGKNASLGEMYQKLTKKGVNIPNGFATTAHAYVYFVEKAGIKDKIRKILTGLNTSDVEDLAKNLESADE